MSNNQRKKEAKKAFKNFQEQFERAKDIYDVAKDFNDNLKDLRSLIKEHEDSIPYSTTEQLKDATKGISNTKEGRQEAYEKIRESLDLAIRSIETGIAITKIIAAGGGAALVIGIIVIFLLSQFDFYIDTNVYDITISEGDSKEVTVVVSHLKGDPSFVNLYCHPQYNAPISCSFDKRTAYPGYGYDTANLILETKDTDVTDSYIICILQNNTKFLLHN